jgi:nitroimidazol reductase NimA-like FMN-containing flavoprotein (pyridoxamine 5'-phosphate oxidase superfamily)
MREMSENEIKEMVQKSKWASICTVTPNGKPYAVEATYFLDGEDLCFMINPRGTTMNNIQANPEVLLKITMVNKSLSCWYGISLFAKAGRESRPEKIIEGWELLGRVMNSDYSKAAKKFSNPDVLSPFLRCKICRITGRAS